MKIIADLHVHSKYSRATAKDLTLESLYVACQIKGVQVVATGDFCHPEWFKEIETKLEPSEPGLFRLISQNASVLDQSVPGKCRGVVRFILATEISNIYKKDGKIRKNHNLVYLPDLDAARRFNRKIEKIGNIQSDGRPIIGLDARDLLELVLESSSGAFLIPAHIWTPWFSMLGSKSGFDSMRECFGDLTGHVFAVETGLSSDPAMNWRVSFLDGITLVSNSDAHSPANIAREANLFDTDVSYFAMMDALKAGGSKSFCGTIEFFPEEGKYHMDGHRNCGVCLEPNQSMARQGICPKCAKPLTIGVLHRVEELADRGVGQQGPQTSHTCQHLVPLADVLSEILQTGSKSQKVSQAYRTAIRDLGPELRILMQMEPEDIKLSGVPLLGEAVKRIREKRVHIHPGFDGEYGRIKIFDVQERAHILGQRLFFSVATDERPVTGSKDALVIGKPPHSAVASVEPSAIGSSRRLRKLKQSEEQRRIVEYDGRRLLILAGPGTGKTQALTWRIATQIMKNDTPADRVLAITFTNKAANEMRSRLKYLIGDDRQLPIIATFHGFCLKLLAENRSETAFGIIDEHEQNTLLKKAISIAAASGAAVTISLQALQARIRFAKQNLILPEDLSEGTENPPEKACLITVYQAYQRLLEIQGLIDFEDLIFKVARRLDAEPEFRSACQSRFQHIYIDEYQDLNLSQYRIIRNLVPAGSEKSTLCAIGDPDQSIYGFRGSDSLYFRKFLEDYPDSALLHLTRNYRSTNSILSASYQVINQDDEVRIRTYSSIEGFKAVSIIEAENEHVEAESIARTIERQIGGTGFHSVDTGRVSRAYSSQGWSYADFAVLTRTSDQLRCIAGALKSCGIPFQLNSRRQVFKEKGIAEILSLSKVLSKGGSYQDFRNITTILCPDLGRKAQDIFTDWCIKNRLCLKDGFAAAVQFPTPGLSRKQQLELNTFIGRVTAMTRETVGLTEIERLFHLIHHPFLAEWMAEENTQEALTRLVEMAAESGNGDEGINNQLALFSDTDFYHPRAEKTALMTMHAAKGLEFAVVFIAGCEDQLIPYQRFSQNAGSDIGEERRLFYVAMTRAKERLYLTWARRRRLFGKTLSREKSPFVNHIEERLLQNEPRHSSNRKRRPDQLQLF